jgi:starch phosphorylase
MDNAIRKFIVAYFSHEFQLFDDTVRTSSGGLGVVARDDLYGFEQLKFPAIGITLWSSHGYARQIVRDNSWMDIIYPPNPIERTMIIGSYHMNLSGKQFKVNIRQINDIHREHTMLIGLDTDLEENPLDIRLITRTLYGGLHSTASFGCPFATEDWIKICQQALLGIGGMIALRTLGIEVDLYHMNESHGAYAQMLKYQELLNQGYAPVHAEEKIKQRFVYTNHTPIEAGNPVHSLKVSIEALSAYINADTMTDLAGGPGSGSLKMTEIAFRLSRKWNGVADLHAAVIREMYKRPEILGIRNGIYVPAWQMPEFRDEKDPMKIPEIKTYYKEIVYRECLRRAKECGLTANDNVVLANFLNAYPTLSFARRWAGYKRLQMPIHERERPMFDRLIDWGLISLIWGGSPHADDKDRRNDWNHMLAETRKHQNALVFLNYDPWGMKYLKAAADIWLNFMWFGREACGTSWMSAMLNCALNMSILDGGVPEAKQFVVGYGSTELGGWEDQYAKDADAFWKELVGTQLPRFWHREPELYNFLFNAKEWAEENLSVIPTCKRYITELYEMEVPQQ